MSNTPSLPSSATHHSSYPVDSTLNSAKPSTPLSESLNVQPFSPPAAPSTPISNASVEPTHTSANLKVKITNLFNHIVSNFEKHLGLDETTQNLNNIEQTFNNENNYTKHNTLLSTLNKSGFISEKIEPKKHDLAQLSNLKDSLSSIEAYKKELGFENLSSRKLRLLDRANLLEQKIQTEYQLAATKLNEQDLEAYEIALLLAGKGTVINEDGTINQELSEKAYQTAVQEVKIPSNGDSGWHVIASSPTQGTTIERAFTHLLQASTPNTESSLAQTNVDGLNPIHVAVQHKNKGFLLELSKLVEHHSITVPSGLNNGPDGKSPIHLLLENLANQEMLQKDKQHIENTAIILDLLCLIDPEMLKLPDNQGQTPLDLAKTLIAAGVKIPGDIQFYLERPQDTHELFQKALQSTDKDSRVWDNLKKDLEGAKAELAAAITPEDRLNIISKIQTIQLEAHTLVRKYTPISVREPVAKPMQEYLADRRAKKEIMDAQYENQNNYMHYIAENVKDEENLLGWINAGTGISAKLVVPNSEGNTPIHHAILTGNVNFVRNICDPTRRYDNVMNWEAPSISQKPVLEYTINRLLEATTDEEIQNLKEMAHLLGVKKPSFITDNIKTVISTALSNDQLSDATKTALEELQQFFSSEDLPIQAQMERLKRSKLHELAGERSQEILQEIQQLIAPDSTSVKSSKANIPTDSSIKDPKENIPTVSPDTSYKANILQDLTELHSISIRETKSSPITDFVQTIFSKIKEWRRATPFVIFTKEHNLNLLIQQNASVKGFGRGALYNTQKNLFENMLEKMIPSASQFEKIHKNIEEMHSNDVDFLRSFFVGNHTIANELYRQYENLNAGDSMLMDLSSIKGFHGMKGQIHKNEDNTYTFQMANTGAGIETYKWHKEGEHGFVQTVVEWKGLKEIPKEFFNDMVKATLDGKLPKNTNNKTPFELTIRKDQSPDHTGDEDMKAIDAVYATLEKWMPTDKLSNIEFDRTSPYWSLPQEGPSCIPQSIWAILRVSTTTKENEELKLNFQLKNLKHLYKQITSGEDRSSYSCQKAYEQAIEIISTLESDLKQVPAILQHIANDLKTRMENESVTIDNRDPFVLSDDTKKVTMRSADLTPVSGGLKAQVKFSKIDSLKELEIQKTSDGKPTGVVTLAYLLYESLLTNDQDQIEKNLEAFTKYIDGIDDPKDFPKYDLDHLMVLSHLFTNLSADFRKVDGTLASRAKPVALSNISQILFSIYYVKKTESHLLSSKDIDLHEAIQEQLSTNLSFLSRFGGKLRLKAYYPNNKWYQMDRNLRPFIIKPAWIGHSDRLNYNIKDVKKEQQSIPKRIEPARLNGSRDIPKFLPTENGVTKVTISTFRYEEKEGRIYSTARSEVVGTTQVEITKDENGFHADSLIGVAYLYSALLAEGERSPAILMNLQNLIYSIEMMHVEPEEIPILYEMAASLSTYCKSSGSDPLLDKSPKSATLEHAANKLSLILLQKCKTAAEQKSKSPTTSQSEKETLDSFLSQIQHKTHLLQQDKLYYEALNPRKYSQG